MAAATVPEIGAAGLPIKPHKPRCLFGSSHSWIQRGEDEADSQCWICGRVSSAHPASKVEEDAKGGDR